MPETSKNPSPMHGQQGDEISQPTASEAPDPEHKVSARQKEIGGPAGPDPTRYGDWEKAGRCIDF